MCGKAGVNLVCGIGFNEGRYPAKANGKPTKEYSIWKLMLRRCTTTLWETFPSYTGVTCSENFKSYSFFYEWYHRQVGSTDKDCDGKSWHLDKDLLVKGNKVYSEDTCLFLPPKINTLLPKCDASRGEFPIGVDARKRDNKFRVRCSTESGSKFLGDFSTKEEAFNAYKYFKEGHIKSLAEKYKEQIDERAYQALLNYRVEITD